MSEESAVEPIRLPGALRGVRLGGVVAIAMKNSPELVHLVVYRKT